MTAGPATRLRLRVPRYALDLAIETLPDLAPASVEALVASLPAAGLATAEFDYGSAVCLRLPDFPRPLRPECSTAFPVPGDVVYFGTPPRLQLNYVYGRDVMPYVKGTETRSRWRRRHAAARSYSWMSPPRRSRHTTSPAGAGGCPRGSGGRSLRARCGRPLL